MQKRIFKKHMIVGICSVIAVLLIFWCISVLKCEILTRIHGDEFKDVYQAEDVLKLPDDWKVLSYSNSNASIYYTYNDNQGGYVLNYTNTGGDWLFDSWGAAWSSTGSADDYIWPYIR